MEYEILINTMFRTPTKVAIELFGNYREKIDKRNFAEQQRVLNLLDEKIRLRDAVQEEDIQEAYFCFIMMAEGPTPMARTAFENLKKYPMNIWIEMLGELTEQQCLQILNRFQNDFNSNLIETFIINLSPEKQPELIRKYRKKINDKGATFSNFYYAVSPKGREVLQELFDIEENIILILRDVPEKDFLNELKKYYPKIKKSNVCADDVVKLIMEKTKNAKTLETFMTSFTDIITETSDGLFELLITRYKYLGSYYEYDYDTPNDFDDEEEYKPLEDLELFNLFKERFHKLGIEKTLNLFDHKTYYSENKFTEEIILNTLDIAYEDLDISEYVNDETARSIMARVIEDCEKKEYQVSDLEMLLEKITSATQKKFFHDDYIEAIICCRKLMKDNLLTDKSALFIKLKKQVIEDLLSSCQKDGTYPEDFPLDRLFYRLVKGNLSLEDVYLTKTYKGLIFLAKSPKTTSDADYITNFLTDSQLANLNITPIFKWQKNITRTNTHADNAAFIERFSLQLYLYFGLHKGKYLLDANIQGNRMENLFDGLNYKDIKIAENGQPLPNEELLEFLFGRGRMKEINSNMNKMIRGELPDFEKYFSDFCNNYSEIKEKCHGILSAKRIVKTYEDVELPISLKPSEVHYKKALREMNTTDPQTLQEAVELCNAARERKFSTIPKIKGTIGDYSYEILDLDDPMGVAVGNLSHCCFVVQGISYSALKHALKSQNGRIFVVYYKGQFLTQSWVWRNGDVICFDSVEAGAPVHEVYKDNSQLYDVYEQASYQLLNISRKNESETERVKVVTMGKSDYRFSNLNYVLTKNVPRPLESGVYVYDSNKQSIVAGIMPENPRYGEVSIHYEDPRPKVIIIDNNKKINIDTLDETFLKINDLRYRIKEQEEPIELEYDQIEKMAVGKDWYLILYKNGMVDSGTLSTIEENREEYLHYLKQVEPYRKENMTTGQKLKRKEGALC